MKKLIIKIGNETHEFPYNDEVFSFEVSEKYVPKVGDCVMIKCKEHDVLYWCKLTDTTALAYFKISVDSNLRIHKNGYFRINENSIYTQITPEELKAKYAEAGYDWDYETDTITPLKWTPKDGDEVWYLESFLKPVKYLFDEEDTFIQLKLEKGLLFKTKEECQKFADHCLSYINNKK